MAEVVPVVVTETVQAGGDTVTQQRETVQDASKLPRVYVLPGETQQQKLESLRAWVASNRVFHQLELLAYVEDVMTAPSLMGPWVTPNLTVVDEGVVVTFAIEDTDAAIRTIAEQEHALEMIEDSQRREAQAMGPEGDG